MLEFVKLVQQALPVSVNGVHVGVVTFGTEAEVNVDFNVHFNQESFNGAIDGINYAGKNSFSLSISSIAVSSSLDLQ